MHGVESLSVLLLPLNTKYRLNHVQDCSDERQTPQRDSVGWRLEPRGGRKTAGMVDGRRALRRARAAPWTEDRFAVSAPTIPAAQPALALATALATAVVAAGPPPTSSPPLRSAARLRVLAAQRGNGLSGVEKPARRPTPYQAKSDERLTERGPRPRPCRARRSCCWPQAGWPCCSRRGTRFVRNVRRRAGLRHCDRPAASRPELSRGRETVLLLGSHLRRGAPCRRPWRWQPLRRRRCTSG